MFKKWREVTMILLLVGFSTAIVQADDKTKDGKKAAAKKDDAKKDEPKEDRFAVPDGTADELITFIEKIQRIRPKSRKEFMELRKKVPAAIKQAAEKILELDKDPKSINHLKAKEFLLSTRVGTIFQVKTEEKKAIYQEVLAHLKAKGKNIDSADVSMASRVCYGLRMTGDKKLLTESYTKFSKILAKSSDKKIVKRALMFEGAARLVNSIGKKLTLKGTTLDGKEFDIASLKGKVVLVDFWATWCGPCIGEIPSMKKMYKAYHDRGFEIIGVNLDQKRSSVEKFLEKRALPWNHLFEDGKAFDHPMSVYYGIMAIPQMILVDKDGTVISTSARGKKLEKLLSEKIGPLEAKDEEVKTEK